jgi:hypothetical protein
MLYGVMIHDRTIKMMQNFGFLASAASAVESCPLFAEPLDNSQHSALLRSESRSFTFNFSLENLKIRTKCY